MISPRIEGHSSSMKNKQFTTADQVALEEIMFHRRDIRGNNFLSDQIPDNVVQKILFSASLAPSVGFSQPWEFVVIDDDKIKNQIHQSFLVETERAGASFSREKRAMYEKLKLEGILEAPVNIAVFYKPSEDSVLGQNTMVETGEYSVVCAIQNMWLMARALNIGLGWVSILDPEEVKKVLNAPSSHKLVAYLCIGYVKEFFTAPELEKLKWKKRKEISSTVYMNKYSGSGS